MKTLNIEGYEVGVSKERSINARGLLSTYLGLSLGLVVIGCLYYNTLATVALNFQVAHVAFALSAYLGAEQTPLYTYKKKDV